MSKITRRTYKRKKIIMGAVLFGAVGLVSTGFAAWVLSAQSEKDQAMNMNVGAVSDKSMEIVLDGVFKTSECGSAAKASALGAGVSAYDKFSFNPKATDVTGRVRWGTGEGLTPDEPENLSLRIYGHVLQAQNLAATGLTIKLDGALAAELTTASAAGTYHPYGEATVDQARDAYINLPSCLASEQNIAYTSEDAGNGSETAYFYYDVTFTWGAEFGGVNPSEYYDDAGSALEMKYVRGALEDMHSLLDAVASITVTITAVPN